MHELDRRAYGVGLEVDLPLWNWNSGRIARAEALLAAGRKRAEATRREVEATVLEVQAACQASVLTATRLKDNVVPRSESAARTMDRTYQLGEASLLEVIDARRTLPRLAPPLPERARAGPGRTAVASTRWSEREPQ